MGHPKCLKLAIEMIREHPKDKISKKDCTKVNNILIQAENALKKTDIKTAYQQVKKAGKIAGLGKIEDWS